MSDMHELSAGEIATQVQSGALSACDVASHHIERIARMDGHLHAYISVADDVMDTAADIDRRVASGESVGPLAGVPVAVKDNICVSGQPTTCASRMLEDYRSVYDAHAVTKMRAAGAVILGKTNLDEFAMGSSSENSAFGATRNPWAHERTPGGSSGGSAAAVAAGLACIAVGSDTGGSIRQPASFCSVSGLKPTYGRVSRFGLVAFGSSLDQIGPFARNAEDVARVLEVIAGDDPRDSTASGHPGDDYLKGCQKGLEGLKVGVPREYMEEGVDAGVRSVIQESLGEIQSAGAQIIDVELPHTRYAIPAYYIVAASEASSNLARFDGVQYGYRTDDAASLHEMFTGTRTEGFGDEVTRRIILGTWCLSSGYYDAYYERAMRVRSLISSDFDRAFREVDVLVGPTSPIPPFRLGELTDDPLSMYMADTLTTPVNLAGLPAASVPAGFVHHDGDRLPVGLQIIAARFQESTLLRAAAGFQKITTHHQEAPAS